MAVRPCGEYVGNVGNAFLTLAVSMVMFASVGADHRAIAYESPTGVKRFHGVQAFQRQAVLDRETELVWERFPNPAGSQWSSVAQRCALKTVGTRRGWRLPSSS